MSHTQLALTAREAIAQMLAAGNSQTQIAKCLGRAPSTISREFASQQSWRHADLNLPNFSWRAFRVRLKGGCHD